MDEEKLIKTIKEVDRAEKYFRLLYGDLEEMKLAEECFKIIRNNSKELRKLTNEKTLEFVQDVIILNKDKRLVKEIDVALSKLEKLIDSLEQ
jgi:hypothetical protein